jgi:hypothetical protein
MPGGRTRDQSKIISKYTKRLAASYGSHNTLFFPELNNAAFENAHKLSFI